MEHRAQRPDAGDSAPAGAVGIEHLGEEAPESNQHSIDTAATVATLRALIGTQPEGQDLPEEHFAMTEAEGVRGARLAGKSFAAGNRFCTKKLAMKGRKKPFLLSIGI